MLLTCPHCATIFQVDADLVPSDGKTVRCSVCDHVWKELPFLVEANGLTIAQNTHKKFWNFFLWALLMAALASGMIINRASVTAYAPFLISGFDAVGFTIRPTLSNLEVVNLTASYVGDTLRLSGGLRNITMWRNHSADLRVTVRSVNGVVLHETVVEPDDDIIDANTESSFFVQLAINGDTEVHVTVTPLSDRVYH